MATEQVRVLHLLCKHQKSRNPVSRRTGQSTQNVTEEEAHAELKTYEAKYRVGRCQCLK